MTTRIFAPLLYAHFVVATFADWSTSAYPTFRTDVALSDERVTGKLFNNRHTSASFSLLDLFGDNDILVLEYGADICVTCVMAARGLDGAPMAAVKPDLYRFLHSLGHISIVDVVDDYLVNADNPGLATYANGTHNLAQSGIYAEYSTEQGKAITTKNWMHSSTACDAASTPDHTINAHFTYFQYRNIYGMPPPYFDKPESAFDPVSHVFGKTDSVATTAHVLTKNNTHVTYKGGIITLLLAGDVTSEIMAVKGWIGYPVDWADPPVRSYAEQFGALIGAQESFMAHYDTKSPLSVAPLRGKDDMCALIRGGHCSCKAEGAADFAEWKKFNDMWECCAS